MEMLPAGLMITAGPGIELTADEPATVGGQAYTLSAVDAAGVKLESTAADARYTETWPADGEVTLGGQAYTVGVGGVQLASRAEWTIDTQIARVESATTLLYSR